jgi:hypothetical protein
MIREKQPKSEIVIDLTGPDGNAFVLIGYAQTFGKQIGMTREEIHELTKEMQSRDYEHLLEVFDAKFGDFVILER